MAINKIGKEMNKFEKIKNLIAGLENNDLALDIVLETIKKITKKNITHYELKNYWRSESLNDFVKTMSIEPIKDWENIDDNRALELINGILSNLNEDSIIAINSDALEKKYSKASGTISDWIFHDDITNPNQILKLLKEDTVLLL